MLFSGPLALLCGLLACVSFATAKQGEPGVQVMAIGYMPGVGAATRTRPFSEQDKALTPPSEPNLPATITARAEATLQVPPPTSKNDWHLRLSDDFITEMYRLGNEQCDKAGLGRRQVGDPMRCSPSRLPPLELTQLRQGIARFAYQEIVFEKSAIDSFSRYNEEEVRFAAATVVEYLVIDKFIETGGRLPWYWELQPEPAATWMSSALQSQTESGRFWDFVHEGTPTAVPATNDTNATSTTSRKCPLCTNAACLVSPDDDQGQDGTNIPIRPALVTGGADPACVPIQDAQNNNQEWFCLCPLDKGKFTSQSTSWTTYLSDRGTTTTLVSAACPRTDLPPVQTPPGPDVVTRTGEPACIPMQDAQKGSENQEWICVCKKDKGKFGTHSTTWSTFRLDRGSTTSLASTACPSTDPTDSQIPATQVSKATCAPSVTGGNMTPFGAQSTVLASAISSFCLHYSNKNLQYYTIRDPGQDNYWNGRTRTKEYAYSTPAVYNGNTRGGKTIVVVKLSIKYQREACDDPKDPIQSAFTKDSGDWCQREMGRVFQIGCPPFRVYGGDDTRYYSGGEVNAGCIQFGVQLRNEARVGELKMIEQS